MRNITKMTLFAVFVLMAGAVYSDSAYGVDMEFTDSIAGGNLADGNGYGEVGYNYRIGQTEVSIAQFQVSGIVSSTADYWNDGGDSTRNVGTDAPVAQITWHEAAQFCNYMTSGNVNNGAYTISGGLATAITPHNGAAMNSLVSNYGMVYVLPTEDEWYKAAYYKAGTYSDYANGTSTIPPKGLGGAMYDTNTVWAVGEGAVEQNLTKNMTGNVFEWLETREDGNELILDGTPQDMAFRGGSAEFPFAMDRSSHVSGVWINDSDPANNMNTNVGMRIVAIPEPGTISLMSLSTISLFFTRTIRRRKLLGKSLLPIGRVRHCDTFYESEPAEVAFLGENGSDYLTELKQAFMAKLASDWGVLHAWHKRADKAFWNHMVVSHERKVARRIALKMKFKTKSLACIDAVLALIMK